MHTAPMVALAHVDLTIGTCSHAIEELNFRPTPFARIIGTRKCEIQRYIGIEALHVQNRHCRGKIKAERTARIISLDPLSVKPRYIPRHKLRRIFDLALADCSMSREAGAGIGRIFHFVLPLDTIDFGHPERSAARPVRPRVASLRVTAARSRTRRAMRSIGIFWNIAKHIIPRSFRKVKHLFEFSAQIYIIVRNSLFIQDILFSTVRGKNYNLPLFVRKELLTVCEH